MSTATASARSRPVVMLCNAIGRTAGPCLRTLADWWQREGEDTTTLCFGWLLALVATIYSTAIACVLAWCVWSVGSATVPVVSTAIATAIHRLDTTTTVVTITLSIAVVCLCSLLWIDPADTRRSYRGRRQRERAAMDRARHDARRASTSQEATRATLVASTPPVPTLAVYDATPPAYGMVADAMPTPLVHPRVNLTVTEDCGSVCVVETRDRDRPIYTRTQQSNGRTGNLAGSNDEGISRIIRPGRGTIVGHTYCRTTALDWITGPSWLYPPADVRPSGEVLSQTTTDEI